MNASQNTQLHWIRQSPGRYSLGNSTYYVLRRDARTWEVKYGDAINGTWLANAGTLREGKEFVETVRNTPWPAGRTFGELSPDERSAAIARAAGQLQAELTAAAPAIGRVLDADDIVTQLTQAATDEAAQTIADGVPRKLLLAVADLLHIDAEGHGLPWVRTEIVKEARA